MSTKARPQRSPVKDRLHHWLVGGKVMFVLGGAEEVSSFEHNTVVTNTRDFVTANMIGHAQQAIQLQLFEQAGDPHIRMINVHIQAINYLGYMAKEEFYTPAPASDTAASEGGTSADQDLAPVVGKPDPFATPAMAAPVPTPE